MKSVSSYGMQAVLFALFLLQSAASIQGVVLRAGTSTPIESARVDLRPEGTSAFASATTDASGRFVFQNLPPGRYRLSASRDGFVPGPYGAKSSGSTGAVVPLESQQELKNVFISLTPTSMVSGRVYDDRSRQPISKAKVQALRFVYQDGRRILIPIKTGATDDAGEYKLPSLVPGQYIVSVDSSGAPLPFYYPGVSDASRAALIDVPPGIDYTGVDVTVADTPAARLRGKVVFGANNAAAFGVSVLLVPRRGNVATGSSQRTVTASEGTFEFNHVAPGAYDIVATANSFGRLAADMPLDADSSEIENIVLTLQPQLSISGHLTVENFPGELPIRAGAVRVELRREPFTPDMLVTVPTIDATGAFTFNGVTPGDYQLRIRVNGITAYVKSARFGASDALNPPFHIDSSAPLDVMLSLAAGSLDGTIVNPDQKLDADATVVLVPDVPRRQRLDLYYVTGTDMTGHFHVESIAPGDYHLFAWDDVPPDAWQDPDFIRQYESRSKPVRVSEGTHDTVELHVN